MSRDPRLADAERLIGALTACPGVAVLIIWWMGWKSKLLEQVAGDDFWRWIWVGLFVVLGNAIIAASYLWDHRIRISLLCGCAALWIAIVVACYVLKMPLAIVQAVVILYFCLRAIRRLRNGGI